MKVEVSEAVFQRLQKLARPLIDSPDDVIRRLLDAYMGHGEASGNGAESKSSVSSAKKRRPILLSQAPSRRIYLKGLQWELCNLVINKIDKEVFTLREVYRRLDPIRKLRPHVSELEASVRGALERLRDKGLIDFVDNQGTYRKREELERVVRDS